MIIIPSGDSCLTTKDCQQTAFLIFTYQKTQVHNYLHSIGVTYGYHNDPSVTAGYFIWDYYYKISSFQNTRWVLIPCTGKNSSPIRDWTSSASCNMSSKHHALNIWSHVRDKGCTLSPKMENVLIKKHLIN